MGLTAMKPGLYSSADESRGSGQHEGYEPVGESNLSCHDDDSEG